MLTYKNAKFLFYIYNKTLDKNFRHTLVLGDIVGLAINFINKILIISKFDSSWWRDRFKKYFRNGRLEQCWTRYNLIGRLKIRSIICLLANWWKPLNFYYSHKGTFPTRTYLINVPKVIVPYFARIRTKDEVISPRKLYELFRGLK